MPRPLTHEDAERLCREVEERERARQEAERQYRERAMEEYRKIAEQLRRAGIKPGSHEL